MDYKSRVASRRRFCNYRNDVSSRYCVKNTADYVILDNIRYEFQPKATSRSKRLGNLDNCLRLMSKSNDGLNCQRTAKIDDFYKLSQCHRAQYKERESLLQPEQLFSSKCNVNYYWPRGGGKSNDLSSSKCIVSYANYRLPPVLPLRTHSKTPYFPELSLAGVYTPGNFFL